MNTLFDWSLENLKEWKCNTFVMTAICLDQSHSECKQFGTKTFGSEMTTPPSLRTFSKKNTSTLGNSGVPNGCSPLRKTGKLRKGWHRTFLGNRRHSNLMMWVLHQSDSDWITLIDIPPYYPVTLLSLSRVHWYIKCLCCIFISWLTLKGAVHITDYRLHHRFISWWNILHGCTTHTPSHAFCHF